MNSTLGSPSVTLATSPSAHRIAPLTRTHTLSRPQQNGKVLLSQEELARISDAFYRFDEDGSGTLDSKEFREMCRGISGGRPIFETDAKIAYEFSKADADHDASKSNGGVNQSEFCSYLANALQKLPAQQRWQVDDILRHLESWDMKPRPQSPPPMSPPAPKTPEPRLLPAPLDAPARQTVPQPAQSSKMRARSAVPEQGRVRARPTTRATTSLGASHTPPQLRAKRKAKRRRFKLDAASQERLRSCFALFDTNNDNSLDLEELVHIQKTLYGAVSRDRDLAASRILMRKIDKDYSRHISKQEFMDYFVPELEKLGSQSKVDDLLWNLEDGGRHNNDHVMTLNDCEKRFGRARELEKRGMLKEASDMYQLARQSYGIMKSQAKPRHNVNMKSVLAFQEQELKRVGSWGAPGRDANKPPPPDGIVPPEDKDAVWMLPRGWSEHYYEPNEHLPQGRRYYHGAKTGQSKWQRPDPTDFSEDDLAPPKSICTAEELPRNLSSLREKRLMPLIIDMHGTAAIALRATRATFIGENTGVRKMRSVLIKAMHFGLTVVWDAEDDAGVDAKAILDNLYEGLFEGLVGGTATSKDKFELLLTRAGSAQQLAEMRVQQTVFSEAYGNVDSNFSFVWLQQSAAIPLWATKDKVEILEIAVLEEANPEFAGFTSVMGLVEQAVGTQLMGAEEVRTEADLGALAQGGITDDNLNKANAILQTRREPSEAVGGRHAQFLQDVHGFAASAPDAAAEAEDPHHIHTSLEHRHHRRIARRLSATDITEQASELATMDSQDRRVVLGLLQNPPPESPREAPTVPEVQPEGPEGSLAYIMALAEAEEAAAAEAEAAPEEDPEKPVEEARPPPANREEAVARAGHQLDLSTEAFPNYGPGKQAVVERGSDGEWGVVEAAEGLNQMVIALPSGLWERKDVRDLSIKGCGLAELPAEIGKLTALTTLNLSFNQLSVLPPELHLIDSLSALDITNNNLSTLPAMSFEHLHTLLISNNPIRSLPEDLGGGYESALMRLEVENVGLVALPGSLRMADQLEVLLLSGNKLQSLPNVSRWTKLRHLELNRNSFSELPDLGPLKGLEVLHVRGNSLHAVPPLGFKPSLRELDFGENRIRSLDGSLLKEDNTADNLPVLEVLRLDSNIIQELASWVTAAPRMRHLELTGNQVKTIPGELAGLIHLQVLLAAGNPMEYVPGPLLSGSCKAPLIQVDLSDAKFLRDTSEEVASTLGEHVKGRGGEFLI